VTPSRDIRGWAGSVFATRGVPDAPAVLAELQALMQQPLAEYPLYSRALAAADLS
jgi:hypothetical protein